MFIIIVFFGVLNGIVINLFIKINVFLLYLMSVMEKVFCFFLEGDFDVLMNDENCFMVVSRMLLLLYVMILEEVG